MRKEVVYLSRRPFSLCDPGGERTKGKKEEKKGIIIIKKRANGMDGVAHARAIYSADSPHNKKTVNVRKEKRAQHGSARGSAPLLFSYYNKKMKIKINKYFLFFGEIQITRFFFSL
jgi:hypothetical protein